MVMLMPELSHWLGGSVGPEELGSSLPDVSLELLRATIRWQASSYKEKMHEFVVELGSSLPDVSLELLRAKIRWQASFTGEKPSCLCRSWPASESCRSTGITSGETSPAGWLLGRRPQPGKPRSAGKIEIRPFHRSAHCGCTGFFIG
jgi:hypothetical protein